MLEQCTKCLAQHGASQHCLIAQICVNQEWVPREATSITYQGFWRGFRV
jgi:hypothetical protein